ncbi:hypothetical protein [Legionella longbeachae]|uniref:hypothetical protein n=1 Tax=Legionella longbeachae TaxID=450 RepID=UPI00124879C9|nr:hypothetical protein [Legionella longbeachae]QEY52264.1 hypothetical protein FQU71_14105 [Legionella longbeachae]
MKISVGQALLLLLQKYRNEPFKYLELKKLYLAGAKNDDFRTKINEYLKDELLIKYTISLTPESSNHDSSRRYFETQLAYETLVRQLPNLHSKSLSAYVHKIKEAALPFTRVHCDNVTKGYYDEYSDQEYADFLMKLQRKKIFAADEFPLDLYGR